MLQVQARQSQSNEGKL